MISISSVQRTAEELMGKAAIEIPDDYLAGLRQCADTEKGDLSAFVIKAMLENYDAAKEDRRAMCGDTGLPRWYVKIGNEARIEGGPVALEAALRRATARATVEVPLRPNRVDPLWRLPAGDRRRRARRLEGYQHGAGQAGVLFARGRIAQSRSRDRRAGGGTQGARQQHRHGRHGVHGLFDGDRLPYRSRLLPYRRHAHVGAHVLPVVAPCLRAHFGRRPGSIPYRPQVVHRLYAARNGGMGTARGRGSGVGAMAELSTVHLALPAATDDLGKLQIGTVAYLSGRIFTAREGAYKRAIEDGAGMPAARDALGFANFHCSPAATVNADGSYTVGAVTATASFRFAQWLDGWFQLSGCNVIIGKGGMTSEVYRKSFVPNHAIYLTTV